MSDALNHSGALVPDLIACPMLRFPDKVAVQYRDQTLTFAELSDRASRLAGVLHARGIGPGQRVGLLAMNDLEYPEIRIGAQRAGAVLVPLNYRLTGSELAAIVEDADVDLLILGRELEELGRAATSGPVLQLGGALDDPRSYDAALAAAAPQPIPVGYEPERICHISYTSGTTARPKGVMLSGRSIHAGTMAMGHELGATSDAIFLNCTPLFHVGSQVAFSCLYLGGTMVLMPKFEVGEFVETLERTSATHCQLVPTMVQMILEEWGDRTQRTLQRILYGAAPMPPRLLRRAIDAWGCEFVNGFGSTEAMGTSFLTPGEHDLSRPELLASVGRSSTLARSRVVDEDGQDVAVGEIGEIISAGPALMSGYWRNPAATAEALRDGWMYMGDLAYRDADGYLFLVDRRHDKIVTGGENVFPSEVEDVLASHPAVAEAAVIGVPDATWGEAVVGVVVVRASSVDVSSAEIIAHCRTILAGYKVPKQLRVSVEPLPRTATGKLLRRDVRAQWAAATADAV